MDNQIQTKSATDEGKQSDFRLVIPSFNRSVLIANWATTAILFLLLLLLVFNRSAHSHYSRSHYGRVTEMFLLSLFVGSMLIISIYQTIRWKKFGNSFLELKVPGVSVGKELKGIIHAGKRFDPTSLFEIVLECYKRELDPSIWRSRRSRYRIPVWKSKTILRKSLEPAGQGITFEFDIPEIDFGPESSQVKRQIYWELTISTELAGVNFKAFFQIPHIPNTVVCASNKVLD